MTVRDLSLLKGVTPVLVHDAAAPVADGYTSDLLSDVVANCPEGAVLLTIQAHTNTVAVCSLVGATAILVCGGRQIPDDMLAAARKEHIAVLATDQTQFDASHAVKNALLAGRSPT